MFEFLLFITITIRSADAPPPRSFGMTSEDRYSPTDCEKQAQKAADRMGESLSTSIHGAKVEIEHRCVLADKRKI